MSPLFAASDYRRPQAAEIFHVGWCADCAYGKVAPSPSPEEVASFYRIEYYTHAMGPSASGRPSAIAKLRAHLAWRRDQGVWLEPGELGPPGTLLDIGCGDGTNMARFRAAGFDVTGIEPDPQARATASQHGSVHAGTAEAHELPAGQTFRYVLMANSLEHVISPLDALRRVRGRLSPGGRLVIEVPNCASQGFRSYGPLWPWTDLPRHLHFFTRRSLSKALEHCGYAVRRVLYVGYARQFDASWSDEMQRIRRQSRISGFTPDTGALADWRLLTRTAFGRDDDKYDSIRIHAEPV
jgi:SAM-dependent methyltransferase